MSINSKKLDSLKKIVLIVSHVTKVPCVPHVPYKNENRILKCEEYIKNFTNNCV
jgi:hypothetical protein